MPELRALIIEDDQTSINVLNTLLKQHQVMVSIIKVDIGQGFEPSQLSQVEPSDVVFVDLEMPVTNGYTVLQHLRSHPIFQQVPIVAYSTHTSHLNRAKEAGFHSFLGKPLSAPDFPRHLEHILSNIPVWEVP